MNEHYIRGARDGLANRAAIYGCHFGMRSTLETDRAEYMRGHAFGKHCARHKMTIDQVLEMLEGECK